MLLWPTNCRDYMIAMYGKWWFGTCISSNIYQKLIILISSDLQFSHLNIHTSHALKLIFEISFMRFDYTPGNASL